MLGPHQFRKVHQPDVTGSGKGDESTLSKLYWAYTFARIEAVVTLSVKPDGCVCEGAMPMPGRRDRG